MRWSRAIPLTMLAMLGSIVLYALLQQMYPPKPVPLTEAEKECGRAIVTAATEFKTQEERQYFLNTPYAREACARAGISNEPRSRRTVSK